MWFAEELRRLEERGLRRRMRTVEGAQGRVVRIDGREVINFSSNDYLGLASDGRLIEATRRGAAAGTGAGASRLIVGNQTGHDELERVAARRMGARAACLFNSGYHANVGALAALAGAGDVIVSDELNHASIIDGCRLSRAAVSVYRHGDVADAARALAAASGARRRLLVTDSLFSMDGDRAPLRELRGLADEHEALLYVDEAHALGVIGPEGRGVAAEAGVTADVTVATLGKAVGSFGAVVLGEPDLCEWLVNRARSFVFTTGLPPGVVAASIAGLDIALGPEGASRRERLWRNVESVQAIAQNLGIEPPSSQIWPVVVGEERATMSVSEELLAQGILGHGIRPPTVPSGTSRIRFTISGSHEPADLERLGEALALVMPSLARGA